MSLETLPRLTEADVRAWVGDTSFGRSRSYRGRSIINPRRQGTTLKAQCQGSAAQPYRVEVTLDADGIVAADCSCPVGGGGRCKHVAALLMTWIDDPADFREVEDLANALERRSKPELISLIRTMVARHPNLELLLELPTPGSPPTQRTLDPHVIERQVRAAFAEAGDDWYAASAVAHNLESIIGLGQSYVQQEHWSNAAMVFQTLGREVLERFEEMHDEEGDLGVVVNECVSGLGECLSEIEDATLRDAILRTLFDIYCWDVNYGGIGIGDEAPDIIMSWATPDERRRVVEWVRSVMPGSSKDWSSGWRREVLGGFLLQLEQEGMDDETFLRICRETGRWNDLVERLLHLGRVDEAVAAIRQTHDYDLLQMAELLHKRGHGEHAEQLVRERARTSQDQRLVLWLKERARAQGNLAEALSITEGLFWRYPSMAGYQEMSELAQGIGRWEELRPPLLKRLAKEQQHNLLTTIHLEAKEIDQALATYRKTTGGIYGGGALAIQVARAAEATHPQESLRLYGEAVERLIKMQGRDNYATAASYLNRMRAIYHRNGEEQTWEALIGDLRTRHKRLRALQEELTKAGL